MNVKSSEIVWDIRPCEDNPRNSEGDFITLKDGRILFVYCRFDGNAHDNAPCDIAGVISEDGGKTFGEPFIVARASEHGVNNIMSVSVMRLGNGDLGLFYLVKHNTVGSSSFVLRRSSDEGKTFSDPVQCLPDRFVGYYVVNNSRVLITEDGRIIVPAAYHRFGMDDKGFMTSDYYGMGCFFESCDDGRSFKEMCKPLTIGVQSQTGLQEPGIVELPNGTLYAYFRTDKMYQYESFSVNGGKSWSAPTPSRFTSPDSPMKIAKNPYSGKYYAVWNPIPKYNGRITDKKDQWVNAGRTPLYIAESENGIDFGEPYAVETDPKRGFCYPAIFFTAADEMLISYCSGGEEDGMCLARTTVRKIKIDL
ncbi:MAG: exo-alpha-sialidase [Clostridia bacterium]|nr:exo-alpha-sialidase [Clostridia bacterium]